MRKGSAVKQLNKGNGTKKKHIIILLLITLLVFIFNTLFLPSIKSFIYQLMNKEFIEKVEKYALPANIKIVQFQYKSRENSNMFSVSAGASGVIIGREANKYYALTAEHVIRELEDIDQTRIIVIGYDQLDMNDHLSKGGKYQGLENYYKQFPQSIVEYASEKYDLAIISFYGNKDYGVIPISSEIPKYGDVVASMSNPYRERNTVTVGKIITTKPRPFGDKGRNIQYPIVKHTAMISEGSSGSALLNENLEIVGINLGGGENIFRKFVNGMAMPSDGIRDFLDEWEQWIHAGRSHIVD